MSERFRPVVRPVFSLNLVESVQLSGSGKADVDNLVAFRFVDFLTGKPHFAVLETEDREMMIRMQETFERMDPQKRTREAVLKLLSEVGNAGRYAEVTYSYNRESKKFDISCQEPSCRFHLDKGCTNPEVLIDDDCLPAATCLTYEEKDKL